MPLVLMQATDFGLNGNEDKETLDTNEELKAQIEKIRLEAGKKMNLGDVKDLSIPKMCLVSKPLNGGTINTRMFIPHVVHEAIGVLAAVSVATACVIPETVCGKFKNYKLPSKNADPKKLTSSNINNPSSNIQHLTSHFKHLTSNNQHSSLSIEHPSGEFTVNLEFEIDENGIQLKNSGVIRTARIIAKGECYI
jgi:4-oxalomesaconate tautomerase